MDPRGSFVRRRKVSQGVGRDVLVIAKLSLSLFEPFTLYALEILLCSHVYD